MSSLNLSTFVKISFMDKAHILIVEDETTLGLLLKENLKTKNFIAKLAKDGEEGWKYFSTERFDLCIIDINMPKLNGFELAKRIREKNTIVPIIFLTANSSQDDKIRGFDYGADEYITKPFNFEELVARIKAILKRTQYAQQDLASKHEQFTIGNTTIDVTNHKLLINGTEKKITTTEGLLFKLLLSNKNQLITRNTILIQVWGRDDYYTARNLDVYINKLRKLIKDDQSVEIVNVHGSGFKIVENI